MPTDTAADIGKLGRRAVVLAGDVREPATADALVEATVRELGAIDILVNNAGTIRRAPAVDFSDDDWAAVLDVNLTAVFRLCRAAGKRMLARGRGKIVNIASLLSFQGGITVPAYAASKGGVAQLTKALANEWAGKGVNVNAIAPGLHPHRQHRGAGGRPGAQPADPRAHPGRALGRARRPGRRGRVPRRARQRLRQRPRAGRRRRLDGTVNR